MKVMKFFVCIFVIAVIVVSVYLALSRKGKKGKRVNEIHRRAIVISTLTALFLVCLLTLAMYMSATTQDTQCTTAHSTSTSPPAKLKTATDYFEQGNYDYDTGNCAKAIADYTGSIKLNSKNPQAYNNRAYTFMRMHNYAEALPDLTKAIALNPNYINALMNRGDIHNYYYAIDRKAAITDYEKVMALGGTKGTSVCGHLYLAEHNGWNLGTLLGLPMVYFRCR